MGADAQVFMKLEKLIIITVNQPKTVFSQWS